MSNSWLVWRRTATAAPGAACAVAVLALVNTALVAISSLFVSRAVNAAVSHPSNQAGHALIRPLVELVAALLGTALSGALLAPTCLRLERAVVLSQVETVTRRLEMRETARATSGPDLALGALAERIVGMPHREALGAVADLVRTRCRGLAGIVVLGTVSPLAAVVLAVCNAAYGRAFTAFLDDVLSGFASDGPLETRRARYIRSLHFDHSLAGELRTFGALPWLLRTFTTLSETGRAQAARERRRHSKSVVVHALVCTAALLGCFVWLVSRAWSGGLDIAQLTFGLQGALLMLDLGPAGDVAVMFRQAARVERDLGAPRTPSAPRPAVCVPALDAGVAVACRSIGHTYPGAERHALGATDLEIRSGERVAVVGRNGAGKSTLFGIVAGSIEPSEGSIGIDTRKVSIALQRTVRYPATLKENISLGDARIDVGRALAAVGGIDAGNGGEERLDALLGSPGIRGENLSGGQWQRVGLARAFARATDGVLLLDEPSAALDPVTEAEFFRVALDHAGESTIMLSTHHLANTRYVDRIIVLDDGRVVQQGTHAELMHRGGLYADMFAAQALSYGVDTHA